MKLIVAVVLALMVAAALAAPAEPIKILRSDLDQSSDGTFSSIVETENGIKTQVEGQLKEVKDEENKSLNVLTMRGSYSYPDPDGNIHTITFLADETGYHAEGEDVPKAA